MMATATRERFAAEYTLWFLREAEACLQGGAISAPRRGQGIRPRHELPLSGYSEREFRSIA